MPILRSSPTSLSSTHAELYQRILKDANNTKLQDYRERRIILSFVNRLDPILQASHPWYISQYQWHVNPGRTQDGVGDLVLTHHQQKVHLVIEFKYLTFLDPTGPQSASTLARRRNQFRADVSKQAQRYTAAYALRYKDDDDVIVIGSTCVNTDTDTKGELGWELCEQQQEKYLRHLAQQQPQPQLQPQPRAQALTESRSPSISKSAPPRNHNRNRNRNRPESDDLDIADLILGVGAVVAAGAGIWSMLNNDQEERERERQRQLNTFILVVFLCLVVVVCVWRWWL